MAAPLKTARLERGQAILVADDGQQVVAEGVRHVLAPVGVRALARHVALHCEALQRHIQTISGRVEAGKDAARQHLLQTDSRGLRREFVHPATISLESD